MCLSGVPGNVFRSSFWAAARGNPELRNDQPIRQLHASTQTPKQVQCCDAKSGFSSANLDSSLGSPRRQVNLKSPTRIAARADVRRKTSPPKAATLYDFSWQPLLSCTHSRNLLAPLMRIPAWAPEKGETWTRNTKHTASRSYRIDVI